MIVPVGKEETSFPPQSFTTFHGNSCLGNILKMWGHFCLPVAPFADEETEAQGN